MPTLGYLAHGTGPRRVLVLHDWMGDHRNYEPMLPYLSAREFSYAFVDHRGYGLSRNIAGEYSLAEAAQDVLELADALGWRSFRLVGHSMSSLIAQQVPALVPERVDKLVLLTPIPACGMVIPEPILEYLEELAQNEALRFAALGNQWGDRLSRQWLTFKLRRWSECAEPRAVLGYERMFSSEQVVGVVPRELPALAIVGEYDSEPFTESSVQRGFSGVYTNFQLSAFRNAGHYPMQETPVALATSIERFLFE